MAILIKNPEVERKARELASLRGLSITAALEGALDKALADAQPKRKPNLDEMIAANERFRQAAGLDKRPLNVTKADFDALWEDGDDDR
ncbi:type II toxin-antitoxin system VapB family antitoxin [Phenylobacterium sp.]|uniref:type II toxin-antitoxin system VapB family antitoxin n=1 Tax=Phenylobacterium sp. TaxID=1871053 RepID=UPI00301D5A24